MPTATTEQIATAYEDAADLLQVHGWAQGAYCNDLGAFCALGALRKASGLGVFGLSTGGYLRPLVRQLIRPGVFDNVPVSIVIRWNDNPTRKAIDVIDLLRGAAKDLRNEATL